jgi:hypothetical protein
LSRFTAAWDNDPGRRDQPAETPAFQENNMTTTAFTKMAPPEWLLAFWREIDDKTFGKGFDCFAEDATCRLGVAEWNGREQIRDSLRAFIDKGFTAHHDVEEYWDGGSLKVFRGVVTMKFDDPALKTVKPVMTHFFYMDSKDPSKVRHWFGSVGPTQF